MGGASAAYNELVALRPRGLLDRAALTAALDALVARREALRTRLVGVDGEVLQRIGPPDGGFADCAGGQRQWMTSDESAAQTEFWAADPGGAGRRDSICGP